MTVIPRTGGGKTGMSNETTFSMLLRQCLHRKHFSEFKKAREASCVRAPTNICSYGVLGHRRDEYNNFLETSLFGIFFVLFQLSYRVETVV